MSLTISAETFKVEAIRHFDKKWSEWESTNDLVKMTFDVEHDKGSIEVTSSVSSGYRCVYIITGYSCVYKYETYDLIKIIAHDEIEKDSVNIEVYNYIDSRQVYLKLIFDDGTALEYKIAKSINVE